MSAATVAVDTDDGAAVELAAKALTSRNHGMQLGYYDTKTGRFVGVDTSYGPSRADTEAEPRPLSAVVFATDVVVSRRSAPAEKVPQVATLEARSLGG